MLRREFLSTGLAAIAACRLFRKPEEQPLPLATKPVVDEAAAEEYRYATDGAYCLRVAELTQRLHQRLYTQPKPVTRSWLLDVELTAVYLCCRELIRHGAAGVMASDTGRLTMLTAKTMMGHEPFSLPQDYRCLGLPYYAAVYRNDHPTLRHVAVTPVFAFDDGWAYFRPTPDDHDSLHDFAMDRVASQLSEFMFGNPKAFPRFNTEHRSAV
jgi:hypothetical protein